MAAFQNRRLRGTALVTAIACWSLIGFGLLLLSADDRNDTDSQQHDVTATDNDIWRTSERCGVNATYLFLRLKHVDVQYESVREGVPISENGSSFEDIRRFIASQQVRCSVIRTTPKELVAVQLPCIALLDVETTTSTVAGPIGHFVVILAVHDNEVSFIDGSTGTLKNERIDRFLRSWTGYVLAGPAPTLAWPGRFSFVLMCFAIGVVTATRWSARTGAGLFRMLLLRIGIDVANVGS